MKLTLLPFSLATLATAHFTLEYPPSRGVNTDTMGEFPCGGFSPSKNRTQISLSSPTFPVSVKLGHSETAIEFLLAVGSNPGSNFNITLHKTFGVKGLGDFCIPDLTLDEELLGTNLTDGLDLTLQVQSNAHGSGGLYSCADLVLTRDSVDAPSQNCKNNTGITATVFTGAAADRHANESTADGQPASGSHDDHDHSDSNSTETSSSSGDSPTSTAAASALQTAGWGVLGAAVIGGLAVL